jgi:hypothetical protein
MHMMRRVLYFVLLAYSLEGVSMSLLTKPEEEVVLCSPMEGRITYEGKPAVGAKIIRSIKWKDDTADIDTVYTNDKGRFNLPKLSEKVKLQKINQFVVHQEITINFNGEQYYMWVMGKIGKNLYSELGGKPVNFRCELTDELIRVESDDGLLGTPCKWDSIEKIKE